MTKAIKKEKKIVWGQEIEVEVIPEGVSGLKNKTIRDTYSDIDNELFENMEYSDYLDYDDDDIDLITEEIKKEQADMFLDDFED